MTDHANSFLASLSSSDRAHLGPHLKPYKLEQSDVLQEQGARIEHVYFPVSGIVSILALMKDGHAAEAAMIGRNGAVNVAAGLGHKRAISRAMVQAPGSALRITAAQFLRAARHSPTLAARIFAHQEMLLAQVQQTAACNSLHKVERRLARWLLQALDHLGDGNKIPFTHEFLSNILGVRRSTITVIASALQKAGLIRYNRGRIAIPDRRLLEKSACECYSVIRAISRS